MNSCPEKWREFFETYCRDEVNWVAGEIDHALHVGLNGKKLSVYVDFLRDLSIYDGGMIGKEFLGYPEIVIDHAHQGLSLAHNIHNVSLAGCRVRFIRLPTIAKLRIRDITTSSMEKFISIEGIVRKKTEVRPRIIEACFECQSCGIKLKVPQEEQLINMKIYKPYECRNCNSRKFKLLPRESIRIDNQRITVQEYPENLRGGEQPQTISVILEEDLINIANPGDRVIVNGIVYEEYRDRQNSEKVIADNVYLRANSVEIVEQEYEEIEINEEDRNKILELSRLPDIVEKIINSIAPFIYGHETIKEAIALQMFGGVRKVHADRVHRGDTHILLVGDPGAAKSRMIKYVRNIAPRNVTVTGKGTSTAGLVAAAVQDKIDGRWTAEAGALPLADKGVCIIDEFDKMDPGERSAVHDAMEDQEYPLTKAGLNVVFKTRCSVLAAANPKYSRFDRYMSIQEQVAFPPSLLTRFDLIFIVLDRPDQERDAEMSRHIYSSHVDSDNLTPEIDLDLLRKYIAYSKQTITQIKHSQEAMDAVISFFVSMRTGINDNSPVPVTARQQEGIIRLAEASARMRLSNVVTLEDASRAIRLVKECLKDIADPETMEIDIDALDGTSKAQRDKIKTIKDIVRDLEESYEIASESDIIHHAGKSGIKAETAKSILYRMKMEGDVMSPTKGCYRLAIW